MEPTLQGRTILIVDDEPLIALDIAQGFKDAGAEVVTTSTLKQAVVLVEHDGLSAAILDHVLIDGDSVVLRQRLKERDIPFVVYSGFGESTLGTDVPLVKKPATADVLIATVASLLKDKKDGS